MGRSARQRLCQPRATGTRPSRTYAGVGKSACGSSMISQLFKRAAKGARMAPLHGGVRGSGPAQQAMMICKGMATHSLAILRDDQGEHLPSVVKASSSSAEFRKPNLPSPSLGMEWFPLAGSRHFRGYAATTAPGNAKNVQATDPHGDPDDHLPGMPDAPAAAAATYYGLAAFQLVCAVPHLIAPEAVAATLLAVRPLDPLFHFPLNQLVGIGYVASTVTLLALSGGAARKELHKTKYRRLNLGMMASATALLAVRAVHADLQTPVADILTVVQAGLTAGIPFYYYSMTKKDGFVSRDVTKLISSDLRKLLQPANAKSVVHAALTAAFLGLTTSYIIAPVATLTSILQGASTPDCIALWRNVGAALLILPTWTVNLKEAADLGSPAAMLQLDAQTLNMGLSLVGFGHLMVLLPLWDFPEAGPWLHTVATFWGSVGAVGMLGLVPDPRVW